ncbi:MAG: hypothetical protein ACE5KL_08395 [Alphaproteobacteria bacterium]
MLILRRLVLHAARRIASDPRVQAKAAEVFEKEVKPRAKAAWRQTKPRLDAAKAELQDIAGETDPREKPREFAAKVKQRFFDREKRR